MSDPDPVLDPGLRESLERATGGALDDASLAALTSLTVRHARSLEGLERAAHLTRLDLLGCDLPDLLTLGKLLQLKYLNIRYSKVSDAGGLAACVALESADLSFSNFTSLTALAGLPALRRVVAYGLPLMDEATRLPGREDVRIALSPERVRLFSHRLLVADSGLVFGSQFGRNLLVRPGVPDDQSRTVAFISGVDSPIIATLWAQLGDAPASGLFDAIQARIGKPSKLLDPAQDARIDEASAAVAVQWIEGSELSPALRASLTSLVAGFSTLSWFRESAVAVEKQRELLGDPVPAWLLELKRTLSGHEPQQASWVRFRGADGARVDGSSPARRWYSLGLAPGVARSNPLIVTAHHLIPVAEHLGVPERVLAVRADAPEGTAVYEFLAEDVDPRSGLDAPAACVFDSYASLLDHIDQIRLEDGTIINRQEN